MQEDTSTGNGDSRPASIGEDGYRVAFTIEVRANLYQAGGLGLLIEGDAPDVAAARYAHAGMKCAQILFGLSAAVMLASRTVESRDTVEIPVDWNVALDGLGLLAVQLSDHAVLCISELYQLYGQKGGER